MLYIEQIPYYRKNVGNSDYVYKSMKLTGKWRIVYNQNYDNLLEIQHKGWIFKKWIPEYNIYFLNKKTIFENKCQ